MFAAALLAASACAKVLGMETLTAQNITVTFPRGCEAEAKRILESARKAQETFLPLFSTAKKLNLTVHWRTKEDWLRLSPKSKYGMPTAQGPDAALLPATNVDSPDALVEIIKPLTHPEKLSPAELQDFMKLAPKGPFTDVKAFEEYLGSAEFYTPFLIDFVLPHEIMHTLCNQVGILRQPVWPYEGIAQWSSDYFLRKQGREGERRFYFLLYRMWYLAGVDDPRNENLVKFGNYAWFHGALLTLFKQIEEECGDGFFPSLIKLAEERHPTKAGLKNADWLGLFNQAAGKDLGDRFKGKWAIP
jgi:hypothetical protein